MACCRKSSGMGPEVSDTLQEKLESIEHVFPGTHFSCILSKAGQLVAQSNSDTDNPDGILNAIASIKRAASQFASTLNQTECPVLHITGENHMFSCYDVGPNLLAFFSEISSADADMQFGAADEQMLPLIEELRLLLHNMMQPPP
jgi:predicted regulator of Ras-like GTPase activity (Roadblock/LC7/MglB family)